MLLSGSQIFLNKTSKEKYVRRSVHLTVAKRVLRLSYYTTGIGLVYVVIGLVSGFYLGYVQSTQENIASMFISAHAHFLCMSILILFVGLAMKNWAREIEEKRVAASSIQLRSAEASVTLLLLGAIVTFISHLIPVSHLILIGNLLYFIGFFMVAVGWILGAGKIK